MGSLKRPLVLVCCTPVEGHLNPLLQVTKHLVERQHDVFFVASRAHRSKVEDTGATYLPSIGPINFFMEEDLLPRYPDFLELTPGPEQWIWFAKPIMEWMPSGLESIRSALANLRRLDPDREVVMICEAWFSGILPLKLGAELPEGFTKLPKTLGLSIQTAYWTSVDVGVPLFALTPDSSAAGRWQNKLIAKVWAERCKDTFDKMAYMLRNVCGATQPLHSIFGEHAQVIDHHIFDAMFACHDTILQMCIPPLETPRSDWPSNFKFAGTLPPKELPKDLEYPPWWEEIVANKKEKEGNRKKIVMVGQGTVIRDYTILVQPALRALANRTDILVIAVLGIKSAKLDPNEPIADNVRIIDYFPYDAILPYVDVFLVTGGYGSLQHAVVHGVPMVLVGDTEDKAEIALRGERAGLAVNMRTGRPTAEAIEQAVDTVLGDPKYRTRALELKKEAKDSKALDVVECKMLALLD